MAYRVEIDIVAREQIAALPQDAEHPLPARCASPGAYGSASNIARPHQVATTC